MPRSIPPLLSLLAMALAGGVLLAQGPSRLVNPNLVADLGQQSVRAGLAQAFVREKALALGLGVQDGLKMSRVFTNGQGQVIVRFHQTHQGARVFGSSAVVRVEADNNRQLLATALHPGIQISGFPVLSRERAVETSHLELAPQGEYQTAPSAELIIFPTRFTTGLKATYDPGKGMSWDREASTLAPRPSASYVWAYEVLSTFRNAEDGIRDLHVIVDACTGNVLRKWDDAPAFLPKRKPTRATLGHRGPHAPIKVAATRPSLLITPASPALLATVPTAATGLGLGLYNWKVPLATSANATQGYGYDLWDPTRAENPASHGIYDSNWNPVAIAGNLTCYFDFSQYAFVPYTMDNSAGSFDNTWGDGLFYYPPPPIVDADGNMMAPSDGYHYGDANGQTAAVDAHYAATMTYDMYRHVLGRLAIDGNDSSLVSVVHYRYAYDNAFWDSYNQVMVYGDGSYPLIPSGYQSFTELDIGAHEMSHGVMGATANMDYQYESGGLNEANSDIFSQAIVAYATRTDSDPLDKIPEANLPWTLGAHLSPAAGPFRYMYKPSLDGISQDAWFYGISMLDVHYSSGPGNRMFYYLSVGAPSDPASNSYSPYLPGGMSGIGIDHATRIWYKALTEHFTTTTNYADARDGALAAATDLYGAASPEFYAVENAFAAINVGPAHGAQPRPLVRFPENLVALDSPLVTQNSGSSLGDTFTRTPILPAGTVSALKVNVTNSPDASVTWKAGIGPGFFAPNANMDPLDVTAANGSFDEQGLYHAPRNAPAWCGVRAFSKADPLEFGASMIFVAHMDADGDSEQDALDAGTLALVYGLPPSVAERISVLADPEGIGSTDDLSLQLWSEGFKNAFGQ